MAESSISLRVLYAGGDVAFALLAASVLVVPLAAGAIAWWLRR